ncbi:MAG: putative proteasome accessory factor [Actinomycetota bacterium]|jgi:proteasome accessory factor C
MSARRGPRSTTERLRSLLVMLPWLMERREVPVSEVAERFQLTPAQVVQDIELAAMCGMPPFIDELIDVFVDDDMVTVGVPRLFTRPLQLTAPEGFALLAAARLAMELPGFDRGGALGRALAKLAAVVGEPAVEVEEDQPPFLADVVAATDRCERLRIVYWSAHSDEETERVVTPQKVFFDRGEWYLIADDHGAGAERRFRIDRIRSCEFTGEGGERRAVRMPAEDDWFSDPGLPVVQVRLPATARWVFERYPVRSSRQDGDGWVVELTVADPKWLEELLLRIGSGGAVVAPAEFADVGPAAAAALLGRYRGAGSAAS